LAAAARLRTWRRILRPRLEVFFAGSRPGRRQRRTSDDGHEPAPDAAFLALGGRRLEAQEPARRDEQFGPRRTRRSRTDDGGPSIAAELAVSTLGNEPSDGSLRVRSSDGSLVGTWTGGVRRMACRRHGRIFVTSQVSPGALYRINRAWRRRLDRGHQPGSNAWHRLRWRPGLDGERQLGLHRDSGSDASLDGHNGDNRFGLTMTGAL
jgi:hypothetical protein